LTELLITYLENYTVEKVFGKKEKYRKLAVELMQSREARN